MNVFLIIENNCNEKGHLIDSSIVDIAKEITTEEQIKDVLEELNSRYKNKIGYLEYDKRYRYIERFSYMVLYPTSMVHDSNSISLDPNFTLIDPPRTDYKKDELEIKFSANKFDSKHAIDFGNSIRKILNEEEK